MCIYLCISKTSYLHLRYTFYQFKHPLYIPIITLKKRIIYLTSELFIILLSNNSLKWIGFLKFTWEREHGVFTYCRCLPKFKAAKKEKKKSDKYNVVVHCCSTHLVHDWKATLNTTGLIIWHISHISSIKLLLNTGLNMWTWMWRDM